MSNDNALQVMVSKLFIDKSVKNDFFPNFGKFQIPIIFNLYGTIKSKNMCVVYSDPFRIASIIVATGLNIFITNHTVTTPSWTRYILKWAAWFKAYFVIENTPLIKLSCS